jgi:hypothetical protein
MTDAAQPVQQAHKLEGEYTALQTASKGGDASATSKAHDLLIADLHSTQNPGAVFKQIKADNTDGQYKDIWFDHNPYGPTDGGERLMLAGQTEEKAKDIETQDASSRLSQGWSQNGKGDVQAAAASDAQKLIGDTSDTNSLDEHLRSAFKTGGRPAMDAYLNKVDEALTSADRPDPLFVSMTARNNATKSDPSVLPGSFGKFEIFDRHSGQIGDEHSF